MEGIWGRQCNTSKQYSYQLWKDGLNSFTLVDVYTMPIPSGCALQITCGSSFDSSWTTGQSALVVATGVIRIEHWMKLLAMTTLGFGRYLLTRSGSGAKIASARLR